MIGRRIDRFRILEQIGRGGMATVWKARDELLGRLVAIKVLDESLASTPRARRRFRREAEVAAQLEHPAIVPVYEAGAADDIAYLVMKLVDGETLAQRIARRLAPVDDALRVAEAAVDALGYAHARGVIHRDVTPRNIMLGAGDQVYVLDFGLARVMGRGESTSGTIPGTPAYIPPETLRGEGADPRSDLYSLGVVLYETLTGSRPFQGTRPESIAFECLHGTVDPPSRLRPELGPETDALVLRMMAREPEQRFASAAELAPELHRLRARFAGPEGQTPGTGRAPSVPEAPAPSGHAPPVAEPSAGAGIAPADGGLGRRFSDGRAQAYLAVLPVECDDTGGRDAGERATLLAGLAVAMRAGLAQLDRLHVVAEGGAPAADENLKGFARRIGANLLLRTCVRSSGTAARVTFALLDPESGMQVAGGNVDGSALQSFELENRLVGDVRRALGLDAEAGSTGWRATPRDPGAQERFALALSYLRRLDHEASIDGAISLLEGLLGAGGESAAVHAALARAQLQKYQLTRQRIWEARAAQACEKAARIDPDAPEVMLALGELHAAAGRNAEALAALDRALALRPDLYEAHVARARALDAAGRAAEAEGAARGAIGLRPDDWRGYHTLGLVLFRCGRYAEAVDPWQKVTALAPDNAGAHRNLGSTFFHLDRLGEAMEAFRRSIEIRPNAMAYYNLGTVLFYLERWEECAAAFEKAVALNPSDPRTWGNLGNACRWSPGREARMREALERAAGLMREQLDRQPGEGEDWARLGGWLANLDRREEAEQAVRRALEMSPGDVQCMVASAHTLLALGHRGDALCWLGRAVEHGYGVDALRRSPELRALAGDPEFERILESGSLKRGAPVHHAVQEGRPSS